jgi:hypothetical protein
MCRRIGYYPGEGGYFIISAKQKGGSARNIKVIEVMA